MKSGGRRKVGPKEMCPCGSGKASGECHKITQIFYMHRVRDFDPRQVRMELDPAHEGPFAIEVPKMSRGIAQSCPACGHHLVVGPGLNQLQFKGGALLRCACGAVLRPYRSS